MTSLPPIADPAPPTIQQVRAWIGVAAATITDEQLQGVLNAELGAQADLCKVEPWKPQLTQAILRRCGREVAAIALPLGSSAGGEYGGETLPRYDAEIERLERPFRKVLLA